MLAKVQQVEELPDMKDPAVPIPVATFQPNHHPFDIIDYVQLNTYKLYNHFHIMHTMAIITAILSHHPGITCSQYIRHIL